MSAADHDLRAELRALSDVIQDELQIVTDRTRDLLEHATPLVGGYLVPAEDLEALRRSIDSYDAASDAWLRAVARVTKRKPR